jgi:hypothetical protein
MTQNRTEEWFLAGNAKWRPTWSTPATMEQLRKYGQPPERPLMIGTSRLPISNVTLEVLWSN